jgi:ubiquinone/menaquinone biosynthesis C-methylase UbiE
VKDHSEVRAEEEIHDRYARDYDRSRIAADAFFNSPSCPENRFILTELGDLRGKKVLELGSGTGEGGVFFASRGADVSATDVSSEMLKVALGVAEHHGTTLTPLQMDAATLAFADETFDVVYGANVLHHVDTLACLREVKRVLKPGGKAAFWDPLTYNPVINVYRRIAHQVRSPDEHPLGRQVLDFMRTEFSDVRTDFFWLSTLLIFVKFYFIDQIHPNEERYWKKVIYDYEKIAGLYERLYRLDRMLVKIPGMRWMAWNMAVVITR